MNALLAFVGEHPVVSVMLAIIASDTLVGIARGLGGQRVKP
jgi:hypothetical protein